MPWTEEQSGRILQEFWESGGRHTKIAHCPADGAQIDLRFVGLGREYVLLARCPACDSEADIGRELDPKREQFRPWTEEERKQVEHAYSGAGVKCPVCDTPIDVSLTSKDAGGEQYLLECIRCNNSHVKAPPSGKERRRHPRAPLRQIVQASQACPDGSQQLAVMGSTTDVSEGGLRIEAQGGFAVGSDIVLSFTMGERIVEAAAQVVHFASADDGSASIGVRFTSLSDVDQALIQKYCHLRNQLP